MRKEETITGEKDGQPFTIRFQRHTLKQEETYRKWLKKEIATESKEMLAGVGPAERIQIIAELCAKATVGGCSLTGQYGLTHSIQGNGMREFLRLAAYDAQPGIDDETLFFLTSEYYDDCRRVVESLLPVKIQADGEPEKKAMNLNGSLQSV